MSLLTPIDLPFKAVYEKARFILVWRLAVVLSCIFPILATVFIAYNLKTASAYTVAFLVTFGSALYLKKTKKYIPIFAIFAVISSIIPHVMLNIDGETIHFADILWIVASIILAFFGLGLKYGFVFLVLNSVGMILFTTFSLNSQVAVMQIQTTYQLIATTVAMLVATYMIGYVIYQFVVLQKYSERELTLINENLAYKNELINKQNEEKTVLLKEIHHRVKNNLQIVVSLLRMQSMELKTEESREHFTEAINRIMAMSLIHQKLYSGTELSKINLKSYIEELVTDIMAISATRKDIALMIDTNVQEMSLDLVVPLGLLVNELVSNSLKYAFPKVDDAIIKIEIKQNGSEFNFNYSDNGIWKEPEEDRTSFGSELIVILAEQMNGTVSMNLDNGTNYFFVLNDNIVE